MNLGTSRVKFPYASRVAFLILQMLECFGMHLNTSPKDERVGQNVVP